MKKILAPLILIFIILSTGFALASVCVVRDNGCNPNEWPVLSVWNESNSHAGDYLYYNKKICCPNVTSSYVRTTCNSDETQVMTLYKPNNSHVAKKDYADYKLCTKFSKYLNCVLKSSCSPSDICIASMLYDTNSHLGACYTYDNNICCGELVVNAEMGGPYVKTEVLPTILVVGNVTFSGEAAPYANVSIKIYEAGSLKASKDLTTSSAGKFATTFTNLDIGTYSVNVSANYSMAYASTTDTSKVIARLTGCVLRNVTLNGAALDYVTGLPISQGTAKIAIKENGDEFTTTFTNGRWTTTFTTCLLPSIKHTATVQITDSETGRTSWSEIQFIAP